MDIPGYQIVRELGRGGMATVYLAVQDTLGRQVALKVISPELASDEAFRERFVREGRMVARFRHPQIVTVYDFWEHHNTLLLSMEYLPGGNLKERIERGIPTPRALEIAALIADALAYAHRHDIVHRDIKPANILFREDDTPILTDFGIARLLDEATRLTQTGSAIGSPRYMSPEQVLGQEVDSRSDIYSLGIIFYEMLTGEVPWSDTSNPIAAALKHCNAPIPTLPPDLAEHQAILDKLLAKSPDERYQDAGPIAEDLRRLARGIVEPPELEPTKIVQPRAPAAEPIRRTRLKPIAVSALVLAAAGLGIGGYWLLTGPSPDGEAGALPAIVLPEAEGNRPIAAKVEELALELLDKQGYEQSLDVIRGGLKTAPQDTRLLALQEIVEKRHDAHGHLVAARDYFERNELEDASQALKRGLGFIENHPQLLALRDEIGAAFVKLAKRNLDTGDLESSRARVGQGLWLVPDHSELLSLRDRIEQRIADVAKAEELLEKATQLEQKKQWQDALTAIEEAMNLAPGHPELGVEKQRIEKGLVKFRTSEADRLRAEAQQRLDGGELATSQRLIRDGLALAPDHPGLQALRTRVQEAIANREQAAGILARARESYAERDYDTSRTLLDEGLALAPNHADLLKWKQRVEAQIEQENLRAAQSLLRQATALKGEGKLEEAVALAGRGLKLAPEDAELQALEAEVRDELAERAERGRQVDEFVKEARARLAAGEPEHARTSVRKALELVPDHPQATALLLEAEAKIAQTEAEAQASELLTQARQKVEAARLDEAIVLVEKGLELVPDDKDLVGLKEEIENRIERGRKTMELLALTKEKADAGAPTEALAALDQVAQFDPDNEQARDLRERVEADIDRREKAEKLLAEAEERREAGDFEASLSLIDTGLAVIPDYLPLLSARTQVQQALSAEKLREANAQRADALVRQAREALDRDNLEEARSLAQQGLQLVPDHSDLVALLRDVEERQAHAEEERQEVARLLDLATQKRTQGRLEESLDLVDQGLALGIKNAELTRLKREIEQAQTQEIEKRQEAGNLAALAQKERESGGLEKALALIERGLYLVPSHPELTALKNQVQLELDEAEARAGRARSFLVSARRAAQEGDLEGSLGSIAQGLNLVPDDPALLDLHDTVSKRMAAESQVARLSAQAHERLQQGRLEESLEAVEEALTLVPGDPKLLYLRRDLRSQVRGREAAQQVIELREQARETEKKGDLDEALRLLREALVHAPDDSELVAEEQRIRQIVEKEAKVAALLAECEVHFRADRLTSGAGGTAIDCYQEVLELDGGNEEAFAGIRQIADKYAGWASAKIDQRNLSSARVYLERLESFDPKYKKLPELRERLAQQERALARSRSVPKDKLPTKRKKKQPRYSPEPARPIVKRQESKPTRPSTPAFEPAPPIIKKEPPKKPQPSTPASKPPGRVIGTF